MKKKNKIVEIYTDGACSGNPGPGGYCAILKYDNHEKIISGFEKNATNNKMELKAVIEGLKALKRPSKIKLVTDSQYVYKGITEWIKNWIRNGWKNSKKEDVQNKELWQELYNLTKIHEIEWIWIEGHKGHPENEKCDKIAKETIKTSLPQKHKIKIK